MLEPEQQTPGTRWAWSLRRASSGAPIASWKLVIRLWASVARICQVLLAAKLRLGMEAKA